MAKGSSGARVDQISANLDARANKMGPGPRQYYFTRALARDRLQRASLAAASDEAGRTARNRAIRSVLGIKLGAGMASNVGSFLLRRALPLMGAGIAAGVAFKGARAEGASAGVATRDAAVAAGVNLATLGMVSSDDVRSIRKTSQQREQEIASGTKERRGNIKTANASSGASGSAVVVAAAVAAAKSLPKSGPPTPAVAKYTADLQRTYGTADFDSVFKRLQADKALSARDVKQVATEFAGKHAAGKSKTAALRGIFSKHHNIMEAVRHAAARGGRIAGALAVGVVGGASLIAASGMNSSSAQASESGASEASGSGGLGVDGILGGASALFGAKVMSQRGVGNRLFGAAFLAAGGVALANAVSGRANAAPASDKPKGYLNSEAKSTSQRNAMPASAPKSGAGGRGKPTSSPSGGGGEMTSYTKMDGSTVQATKAQAERWRQQRK